MSWSRRLAALLPRTVAEDNGGTEPDPRFTFANERTFLAWSRTALALVVAGLGIVQLLPPFPGVPSGRHLIGLPLIALGAVLSVAAYAEWVRNQRALRRGEPLPRSVMPWILAATVTGIAVIAGIVLLLSAVRCPDRRARAAPAGRRPGGTRPGPGPGAHVAVLDEDRDLVRRPRRRRAQGERRQRPDHPRDRPGHLAARPGNARRFPRDKPARRRRDPAVPHHRLDRRCRAALPGHRHLRPGRPGRSPLAKARAADRTDEW